MTKAYFIGIEKQIANIIETANNRIYVAVAWFTNQRLFDCLYSAIGRGVEVKALILDDAINRNVFSGLDFGKLSNAGAHIRFSDSRKGTMHNKFCIVDNTIITGSFNWTSQASNNDENIVISDEGILVADYCTQFEELFAKEIDIHLPYMRLKWSEIDPNAFARIKDQTYHEIESGEVAEHVKEKFEKLSYAYKTENRIDLEKLSYTTIVDILTSCKKEYYGSLFNDSLLWDYNDIGEPYMDARYSSLEKWIFIPRNIKEDSHKRECVEGYLRLYKWYKKRTVSLDMFEPFKLQVYNSDFVSLMKTYMEEDRFVVKNIPEELLCINLAKMFFYRFPTELYYKGKYRNGEKFSSINVFGIVKEFDGESLIFYDGWNPEERGKEIQTDCFQSSR